MQIISHTLDTFTLILYTNHINTLTEDLNQQLKFDINQSTYTFYTFYIVLVEASVDHKQLSPSMD